LACKTPVLSVDCRGGVRQILKGDLESALVPRSEEALADGIRKSMHGPKPAVQAKWLDEFAPQAVVQQFLALPG